VPAARPAGEHNACVLAELGLTPAELAALKDSGALVQHEQLEDGIRLWRDRDRASASTWRRRISAAFDLDHCVYQALKAGVSGFLLKDEPAETLAAADRLWPVQLRDRRRTFCFPRPP